MQSRRCFFLSAGAFAAPGFAATRKTVLYAATGPELSTYAVDIEGAKLTRQASVTLPANVQEAWPHPSRKFLYVAWSSNGGGPGGRHGVTAFARDAASGALSPHGSPISLVSRAVFLTVDVPGTHIVVAHNNPSMATVYRIEPDGTLGARVAQPAGLDFGVYAHQVRVAPSNRMVVLVTRGNGPTATKKEDPGALKVFGYKDGILSNRASIAPGGGYGFQPRHLEFHPARPFAYITLERQNKVQMYKVVDGSTLSAAPLFTKETLEDPGRMATQAASAIHAHPNGRFLYVGNRGSATEMFEGKRVMAATENSIAVYSIRPETGEPTLIQNADTHGVHPRTFTLDPSGRLLVVANLEQALVREKNAVRTLPANLAVFRIGEDGKLTFVRKYDQDTSRGRSLFWTGMVELP
ncbi:MAG: 6-phosphogluconolactonase [Bryobacteraceae bacterium]|nr:6-phosphogluconolactonase [Bryobacteraceae bacterium]